MASGGWRGWMRMSFRSQLAIFLRMRHRQSISGYVAADRTPQGDGAYLEDWGRSIRITNQYETSTRRFWRRNCTENYRPRRGRDRFMRA